MSMEDGTLRRLELDLHDLHKKIDGIYDMLMLRHERSGEDKGCSGINEKLLDNQDLCLLFQISPRSLQRYRSLGVLPYKRLGQKTYYTEEDVKQFIKNNVKDFNQEISRFLYFRKDKIFDLTKKNPISKSITTHFPPCYTLLKISSKPSK